MNSQAHTETFCAQKTPSPGITRAAERYLEQYGDPIVMNTYLKITILVLAAVCLILGFLIFRSQKALANIHPKYYLSRWTELFFGRNRYTIQRDFTNALFFMNADVQRAVVEEYRKSKSIDAFIHDSTMAYVDIEVKNVILDDLRQSPYSARVEFVKVYTNPADHSEVKRERWTASVTYVFRDAVQNGEIQVNPLGLTIVSFRADQAFE